MGGRQSWGRFRTRGLTIIRSSRRGELLSGISLFWHVQTRATIICRCRPCTQEHLGTVPRSSKCLSKVGKYLLGPASTCKLGPAQVTYLRTAVRGRSG